MSRMSNKAFMSKTYVEIQCTFFDPANLMYFVVQSTLYPVIQPRLCVLLKITYPYCVNIRTYLPSSTFLLATPTPAAEVWAVLGHWIERAFQARQEPLCDHTEVWHLLRVWTQDHQSGESEDTLALTGPCWWCSCMLCTPELIGNRPYSVLNAQTSQPMPTHTRTLLTVILH